MEVTLEGAPRTPEMIFTSFSGCEPSGHLYEEPPILVIEPETKSKSKSKSVLFASNHVHIWRRILFAYLHV
jgi:hypothetical protein